MAWILVKSTMLRPAAIVLVWQGKIPLDIVFSPREAFNRYIVLLSLSSSVPISCRPMWRSGWRRLTEYSTGFSKLLSKSHKDFTYQSMLFDLCIKKIESHWLKIRMRHFWWLLNTVSKAQPVRTYSLQWKAITLGLRPLWGPSVYYGCAISLIGLVMVRYNIIYTLVSYTISYESIKDESDIARRLILRKYNQLRSSKRSSWRWFLWRYVSVSAASFSTTVVRYISPVLCVLDAVFIFKTHQVSYRLMTFYLFGAEKTMLSRIVNK